MTLTTSCTDPKPAPIIAPGHDLQVTLAADHFWMWEQMAELARDQMIREPTNAAKLLSKLARDLGMVYATARKDDPSLPRHWRLMLRAPGEG